MSAFSLELYRDSSPRINPRTAKRVATSGVRRRSGYPTRRLPVVLHSPLADCARRVVQSNRKQNTDVIRRYAESSGRVAGGRDRHKTPSPLNFLAFERGCRRPVGSLALRMNMNHDNTYDRSIMTTDSHPHGRSMLEYHVDATKYREVRSNSCGFKTGRAGKTVNLPYHKCQ
jgi:hypothetical protein